MWNSLVSARVLFVFDHTCATLGITSPPRSTSTQSPIFTPRRSISSMLCSVARLTVVPPMGTGFKAGDWCEFSRAPNLNEDVFNLSYSSARSIFVGDRPARSFASESEFILQGNAVDFDHDAIDLIGQAFALSFPFLDES